MNSEAVSTATPLDGATNECEEYRGVVLRGTPDDRQRKKAEIDADAERRKQERIASESRTLVGPRWASCSWDTYRITPENATGRDIAQRWLEEVARNLIIAGMVGAGKTHLMACIGRTLLHKGWRCSTNWRNENDPAYGPPVDKYVYWLSAPDWIGLVKKGFASRDEARTATLMQENAQRAGLLLLDDLGKVHPGSAGVSWLEEQFYNLINPRYRDGLPTVVTTEWEREALSERVGLSVVSRLLDGAMIAPLGEYEWRKPVEVDLSQPKN